MDGEELVCLNEEESKRKPDIVASSDANNKQQAHNPKPESGWKNIRLQTLSSIVISFSMMHMGMTIAFPNLLNGHMNQDVISNFASLGALSTPVGSCFTSLLTDRLGRKITLIILELLSALTWALVALADADPPILFYVGGVVAGITRGGLTSQSPAFISEITHNKHRQMFLSFTTFFFTIAYCLTSLLNLWLTWKSAAWCFSLIFILLTTSTYFFVPESPHWLAVIKLDSRRARGTLKKYNPHENMFEKEWSVIQTKMQSVQTSNGGTTKLIDLIRQPTVYKPSIILILLLLFQQACCIYPLSAYAVRVLAIVSKPLKKYTAEIFIVLSSARLLISIVTTVLMSRFNQKQMLNISFIGMLLFSVSLVGIETLKVSTTPDQITWVDWLTVTCFVFYTVFGCVAAMGVPWTIIFELLPTEARGLLGPYFVAFGYVVMSAFLKCFPAVVETIGVIYTFLILGLVNLAGCVFILVWVPETRGKSLSDIENRFSIKK